MGAETACPRCGTPVDQGAGSRFCLECGADLSALRPEPSSGPIFEPKPEQEPEPVSEPEPNPEPEPKPEPKRDTEPEPAPRRNRVPLAAAAAAALAIAAAFGSMGSLSAGGDASGQVSSSAEPTPSSGVSESAASDEAEPEVSEPSSSAAGDEPGASAAHSGSSGGEPKPNGISLVGDVSGMSRDEVAKLFAMVATSSKVADGSGGYVDYDSRDADLAKLTSGGSDLRKGLTDETSDIDRTQGWILDADDDPIASERAFVMARDGDVYAVIADEELVGNPDDADDGSTYWGPRELVVVFGSDGLVERAYELGYYRSHILGIEGQDYLVSHPIPREGEELSPAKGKDYVTFETDDFALRLPGSWEVKRTVPSSEDTAFGLENDGYYFWSAELRRQFHIGVETFDLESYGGDLDFERIAGLTSKGKQVTFWHLNNLSQDMEDYLLEHLELK